MKNTEINKRPRIGFRYWKNETEDFIAETPVLEGVEHINTIKNNSEEIKITATHSEVLERLEMVESLILGNSFTKFTKEKKQEFLAEQNFLRMLNEQLIKSY